MAIAPEIFARFYAAVNTEWPQFGLSADEAETQERRWRHAFLDFEADSLAYALSHWLATSKKRPHVSDLMELAVAHARGKRNLQGGTRPLPHWTRCACGCEGQRWLLLLRDPVTKQLRHYPETVAQLTAALPQFLARIPTVVEALTPLASSPMMRVMQECRRAGGTPLPDLAYRVGLEEGDVPVYDLPHRFVTPFAPGA